MEILIFKKQQQQQQKSKIQTKEIKKFFDACNFSLYLLLFVCVLVCAFRISFSKYITK